MQKSREDYLIAATTLLRPVYRKHGYELPEVHVSVGFPSKRATSNKCRRIGECWPGEHQKGGKAHIFISPTIGTGVEALEVLVHEHVHAFLPANVGHGPAFRRAMKKLQLEGKPTATHAGKALRAALKKLDKKLGGYAHDALRVNGQKKQGTRLLKALCPDCGYIVRITRTWIEKLGCPICPGCNETMVEDGKEAQHPTLALSLKYATSTVRS
tara:strand:+ start:307 stop:945 length:639 start_codon:yes stop_codon:yes gene_type:complete